MTTLPTTSSTSHGGILIPFDMFRLSQLASVYGELLASKARNILDARMVATRQEAGNILLVRIEGSVVGDAPAEFWRANADLALITSQLLPHRVLMYWVQEAPADQRREGFLFAQRGQVIASGEESAEAGRAPAEWPVTKLCQQMRLTLQDLADGFPGAPRVSVPLVDNQGVNDQELLATLAGVAGQEHPDEAHEGPGASTPPAPRRNLVEEDDRRRAAEMAAEAAARADRLKAMQAELAYVVDELGVVNLPQAGLSEPDLLRPLLGTKLDRELPPGLPADLVEQLRGKRSDVAVVVDFFSEVFVDETKPLSRATFNERATPVQLAGQQLKALEVLAPRLGYGTLVSNGTRHMFVSRKPDLALPAAAIERLLASA